MHGARQNSYEQATRTAQDKTVTGVVPCIAVFFASWGRHNAPMPFGTVSPSQWGDCDTSQPCTYPDGGWHPVTSHIRTHCGDTIPTTRLPPAIFEKAYIIRRLPACGVSSRYKIKSCPKTGSVTVANRGEDRVCFERSCDAPPPDFVDMFPTCIFDKQCAARPRFEGYLCCHTGIRAPTLQSTQTTPWANPIQDKTNPRPDFTGFATTPPNPPNPVKFFESI